MKEDFYDVCRSVWEWENQHNIPYAARLTEWYGDLNMHVPLPGVTDGQIWQRQKDIADGKQVGSILGTTAAKITSRTKKGGLER